MMPNFVECLFNKGAVLSNLNRHQEAYDTFFKIVKIQRDLPGLWGNIALTLLKLKRYSESTEAYEKAILQEPNDEKVWHNKAVAHYELGQVDKAILCCEKALKIDPNLRQAVILQKRILKNAQRH
jgi:tetratricopeptide (TPR) repeat protein